MSNFGGKLTGRKVRIVARPVVARQEARYRQVSRDLSKIDRPTVTGHTCAVARACGKVPGNAPEGFARIGANGLPVGLYRDAGKIQHGRAAGAQIDPFGKYARKADSEARRAVYDSTVEATADLPANNVSADAPVRIDQSSWRKVL